MSTAREEFFADSSVIAALDDYADEALNTLERGGTEADFEDVALFLNQRGFADVPEGPIEVHRTVGELEHVLRPLCPDGSDGCRPKCKWVNGEYVCVWVCRCP